MAIISLIVATDIVGAIGVGNELPWRLSSDLRRFAQITSYNPCIMGYNTYKSIIDKLGHPLNNRQSIVMTNSHQVERTSHVKPVNTLSQAIFEARDSIHHDNQNIFVIGGASVYKQFMDNNLIQEIHLTKVSTLVNNATAYFNFFDNGTPVGWELASNIQMTLKGDKDDFDSSYAIYRKVNK